MTELKNQIEKAMTSNAQELMIAPDAPVRARVGKNWQVISDKLTVPQVKSVLLPILSDEEKNQFLQDGVIEGGLQILDQKVQFQLSIGHQGYIGHFSWIEAEAIKSEKWDFPLFMTEVLCRGQGLSLLIGPRRSGKTAAMAHLLNQALEKRNMLVSLFVDRDELSLLAGNGNVCTYDAGILLKSLAPARSSDLVVVDTASAEIHKKAIELAESGVNVLMTLSAASLISGLEKIADKSILQWAASFKLLMGIDGSFQPCYDLLLATQEIRTHLKNSDWASAEMTQKTSADRSGMRTMNQALLQLILKRKVELKMAFQESSDPNELDQLLKKIGF